MANLKCTVVWLVVLLGHLDLELVQSFPSLSFNMKTCPASAKNNCAQFPKDLCQDDQDCEARYPGNGLKCCSDCGKRCVAPEVTVVKMTPVKFFERLKPRTRLVAKCPTSPPSSESPPGPDQECQNDATCDNKFPRQNLKCCRDGDDFRCMAPVVESLLPTPDPLNGTCPVFPENEECPPEPEDECNSEQECAEIYPGLGMKCCRYYCEMMCVIPEPPPTSHVNGLCPVFPEAPECPTDPDDECKNDQECAEIQPGLGMICCKDGCDMRCVPPIAPA